MPRTMSWPPVTLTFVFFRQLSSLRVVRVLRLARVLKIINKLVAGRAAKAAKRDAGVVEIAD